MFCLFIFYRTKLNLSLMMKRNASLATGAVRNWCTEQDEREIKLIRDEARRHHFERLLDERTKILKGACPEAYGGILHETDLFEWNKQNPDIAVSKEELAAHDLKIDPTSKLFFTFLRKESEIRRARDKLKEGPIEMDQFFLSLELFNTAYPNHYLMLNECNDTWWVNDEHFRLESLEPLSNTRLE